MPEETAEDPALPARPASDDRDGWAAYWQEQGQPWRTEPEIDGERQRVLAARRDQPHGNTAAAPFAGIEPGLTRADIEWLLAAHEDGRGPVDWRDERQRTRAGLDLRGAQLAGAHLAGLPLARLRAGLTSDEWRNASARRMEGAAGHFERADLTGAQLEGAVLEGVHLEGARLRGAALEQANLSFVLLEGATLSEANLERADLTGAHMDGAMLPDARLAGATLTRAMLAGADLSDAHLEGARLVAARLGGRTLEDAALARIRRGWPDAPATLPGANLCGAFFDNATALDEAALGDETAEGGVALADLRWGGANLAVIDWALLKTLGDEREAREAAHTGNKPKDDALRLAEYRTAVRANRQLAVALREQGLNEEADRFAYRAHTLQRAVYLRQALRSSAPRGRPGARRSEIGQRLLRFGQYVFSLFLDALAGYGYRPGRSLVAYIGSLVVFAALYYVVGQHTGARLDAVEAISLSINSFHGRGFFPGTVTPSDAVTLLTAVQAILGLVIEISFIATFTQRFFGR
ncbi:MAG: Pentapeptide repeat family protein [Ktedonobacterales bacterium]|nr:MAG: Pentapeptide repeat family protein [Ktedonobacterales bacterium]